MRDLFLPPPFDTAEILAPILGEPVLATLLPAVLLDHAVRRDPAGVRVGLVAEDGEAVRGEVLAASEAQRARLDFAMAAFGAMPTPVELSGGAAAQAYLFEEEAPEGRGVVPVGEDRARLAEALVEVMGHFGRRPPEEMPALLHGISIRALGRARAPATEVPFQLGTARAAGDVVPVERDFAYAKYFGVEEHLLRHRRFDGTMSDLLGRAVFTSGDAVTVLPFDPRAGTVLLIEQFRAGPWGRQDPRPWCLETVAGRCDRTEPLEATVRREAQEEAGLVIGRLERITSYYPSPGIMSEYITAFVAEADLSQAGGVHGLAEEHEDIRSFIVPLEAALAAADAGEVNNAPLLLSLWWLDRHADRLRAEWG